MHLYKYLPPIWASRMVRDGSVRVGTLYDFRRTETLDPERGDKYEGVRVSLTDGEPKIMDANNVPWFLKGVLRPPPGVKFHFEKDAVINLQTHAPDAYIYCTCSKFDKALMELFGGACVKIIQETQFFQAITDKLDGWEPHVIRRISSACLKPCDYRRREQTWPNVVPYDPVFRKPPEYAHQCEMRAVWTTPFTRISPVSLVVPEILPWCERIA